MPPSYFYHLAFELYPPPPSFSSKDTAIYLAPINTDIFTSELPIHRTIPWGASSSLSKRRPSYRRYNTESSFSKNRSKSFPALNGGNSRSEFLAAAAPAASSSKPAGGSHSGKGEGTADWRLERVSIESVDMDRQQVGGSARPRGKSMSAQATNAASSSSAGRGLATRAKFIPADPGSTDVGWGVVHLYREAEETPGLYEEDAYSKSGAVGSSALAGSFDTDECTTLCILAVPSYMMSSDLLGWVGEQAHEDVSHFRLIRTGKVNRYMVLMKFRDAKKAKTWQHEFNGRPFSSMEPEYAHIVFVKSVTFRSSGGTDPGGFEQHHQSSFPDIGDDPFVHKTQPGLKTPSVGPVENPLATALSTRPFAPPPPNLVELPTCPVCLERMDETTGLLTILCQHVFHCDCLSKWRGSGCPVCRYTQNGPPALGVGALSGTSTSAAHENENNACSVCASDQNLWICLICGNIGCGRYDSAHAFAHFEDSGHAYAMDIGTQHVWDYVGDGYVHRLIQNKADGKMVDLPEAAAGYAGKKGDGNMSAVGADMVPREKMEAMGNEYAYLLQSQLENQRSYFAGQLERAVEKAASASAAAERAVTALESMTSQFSALQTSLATSQAQNASLQKDVDRLSKKSEKSDAVAKNFLKGLQEEKTINQGLMERLRIQELKIKEHDDTVRKMREEKLDLEEQNRDLSLFISAQERIQELREKGEDVDEADVEVGAAKGKGKGRRKR